MDLFQGAGRGKEAAKATDPQIKWVQQFGKEGAKMTNKGRLVRFKAQGSREGLGITVIIEPNGEGIITGFPH